MRVVVLALTIMLLPTAALAGTASPFLRIPRNA